MSSSIFAMLLLAFCAQPLRFEQTHSPPRIIKQPPTDQQLFQVAHPGENDKPFVIECEADGEPTPTYFWTKNGEKWNYVTYDDRISQQPGRGTLLISRPLDIDAGQYQCFAQNEHGRATSNSVFVRKAVLEHFKEDGTKTITVNEGFPFKLECQPPYGWPKPSIYWLQQTNYGSLKAINNSRITLDPEGSLWFSNVTRDDGSLDESDDFFYTCSAASMFRKEYKMGNRVLLKVVELSETPSSQKPVRQYVSRKNEFGLRGERIQLYCIYGGTPLPQTVWTKNGKAVPWSNRIRQADYGKSILIKESDFEDEGTYECEVSNGVGEAQSHSINLKIMAQPYFTVEPEIQTAAPGETVEFRCEASGVPEPTIAWIHNGKLIEEAPPNPRRLVEGNRIVIRELDKEDTGNYGCNATNSYGYVYKDAYVNVLENASLS